MGFDLHDYTAALADQDWLGVIAWFSVKDVYVHHDRLRAMLDAEGLARFAPSAPADSDVFRKITTNIQQTIDNLDGTKSKIMVRDVGTNSEEILRRLVVERVDAAGKRLDYRQMWDLRFDKATSHVSLRPITVEADGTVWARDPMFTPDITDDFVPALRRDYEAKRGLINADGIRVLIKRVLDSAHAVSVRPTGGVLFVPAANQDVVASIKAVADHIEGTTVCALPLVNTGDQREMLGDAIITDTTSAAESLMEELRKATAGGATVSVRKMETLSTAHGKLRARLECFKHLLVDELDTAEARLFILDGLFSQAMMAVAA